MSEEAATAEAVGARVSAALGRSSSGPVVAPSISLASRAGALHTTHRTMNSFGVAPSAGAASAFTGLAAPLPPVAMGEFTQTSLCVAA